MIEVINVKGFKYDHLDWDAIGVKEWLGPETAAGCIVSAENILWSRYAVASAVAAVAIPPPITSGDNKNELVADGMAFIAHDLNTSFAFL
ncbi:MAG: hypothetical protein P0S96_07650 [Simkaniaceae bacterium]|nr:hypothetical protein [Candidatus Sacchlamyda saccharinae]